jgi:hypothetical protein
VNPSGSSKTLATIHQTTCQNLYHVQLWPIEFYNIIQWQELIRMFESLAKAWNMVTTVSVLLQLPLFSIEILHQ